MTAQHVFVPGKNGYCDWWSSSSRSTSAGTLTMGVQCGHAAGSPVHVEGTDGSDLPKLCGHGIDADCECCGDDQPAAPVWNPDTVTWSDEDDEETR